MPTAARRTFDRDAAYDHFEIEVADEFDDAGKLAEIEAGLWGDNTTGTDAWAEVLRQTQPDLIVWLAERLSRRGRLIDTDGPVTDEDARRVSDDFDAETWRWIRNAVLEMRATVANDAQRELENEIEAEAERRTKQAEREWHEMRAFAAEISRPEAA